ncbi:hypothetical protein [Haliangium ochraceum]
MKLLRDALGNGARRRPVLADAAYGDNGEL